jgi:acyl carrier protein
MSSDEKSIPEISAVVRSLLAEHLERGIDEIPPDVGLDSAELGMDSMSAIRFFVTLEEHFDVAMPDLALSDEPAPLSIPALSRWIATQLQQESSASSAR